MSVAPASASRVVLRKVGYEDQDEFLELTGASAELHRPWISLPVTPGEFAAYVARFDQETAVGFLVCLRDTGAIAGIVNIGQIVRGSYQRAVLGYGVFRPSAGHGYVSEGVGLAVRHGFETLGLHRIEADIQPGNKASRDLVERLGFRREGYSPGFIKIDGIWRDHERWAISASPGGV
ncbi:MAG TPA: GNAT family N-acetyltransferase [Streptosporangiaceae bacterium]|nr:GNAT family N-acetyltransferase [Streptosporangiaceae bacterium]